MQTQKGFALIVAVAVAVAGLGCSEELTPPEEPSVLTLPELIVSDAVAAPATTEAAGLAVAGGADQTFVSLPPGTLPEVVSVRIRNLAGGTTTPAIPVIDGGFDPVPVAAVAGDELELTFTDGEGTVTVAHATVPDRRPPTVVRTNPPRGRPDVVFSISIRPTVVFSEPIDPETLAGGIRLLTGGTEVNASVALLPDEPWIAELVPAADLEPGTTYELQVTTEIRDLDGDALEEPYTSVFTAAAATPPSGSPAIAFMSTRDGSRHIYVADADGSNVTRLAAGEFPAWSWDGRRIAFSRVEPFSAEQGYCGGIAVMNADGSGVTPLYEWVSDGCEALAMGMPTWSPDNRTIAFHGSPRGGWVNDTGVFVMNADGSNVRLLHTDEQLAIASGLWTWTPWSPWFYPAWSPDGQSIALSAGVDGGPVATFIMGASGSPLRLLSEDFSAPAWSPDGSRIAGMYWNHEDQHPAIVSYDVSSGDREILFRFPDADFTSLDWSPDGRHIVFTMRTTSEPGSGRRTRIFILTLETGEVRQLIPDAVNPVGELYGDFHPVWSRAGR